MPHSWADEDLEKDLIFIETQADLDESFLLVRCHAQAQKKAERAVMRPPDTLHFCTQPCRPPRVRTPVPTSVRPHSCPPLRATTTQYDKDENLKFFFMEKGDVGPTASTIPSAMLTSGKGGRRRVKALTKITWMQGELLGSGSCGQVFLGLNVDTGRLIAVKQVEHRRDSVSNMNGVRGSPTVPRRGETAHHTTPHDAARKHACGSPGTCGRLWLVVGQ